MDKKLQVVAIFGAAVLIIVAVAVAGMSGEKKAESNDDDNMVTGGPASAKFESWEQYKVSDKIKKTEAEWKAELTSEQFRVMRKQATEPAFSGKYYKSKADGIYRCAACGAPLFDSDHKYDSGSGWPSFDQPIHKDNVAYEKDGSLAMQRVEVHCARCGGHLGHVFDDGPKSTGLRYCINSASLNLDTNPVEAPKKKLTDMDIESLPENQ